MSFLDKLKEAFSKKDDKATYLSGFKKSKQTFGDQLNQMPVSYTHLTLPTKLEV